MTPRARRARYVLRARRTGRPISGARVTFLYRGHGIYRHHTGPITPGLVDDLISRTFPTYGHHIGPAARGYIGALLQQIDPFAALAPVAIEDQDPGEDLLTKPLTGYDLFLTAKYAPQFNDAEGV